MKTCVAEPIPGLLFFLFFAMFRVFDSGDIQELLLINFHRLILITQQSWEYTFNFTNPAILSIQETVFSYKSFHQYFNNLKINFFPML